MKAAGSVIGERYSTEDSKKHHQIEDFFDVEHRHQVKKQEKECSKGLGKEREVP